jgi:hypothetical protein
MSLLLAPRGCPNLVSCHVLKWDTPAVLAASSPTSYVRLLNSVGNVGTIIQMCQEMYMFYTVIGTEQCFPPLLLAHVRRVLVAHGFTVAAEQGYVTMIAT